MLNEFLEFEAYTKNPTSENPRLQPMMLTHSFSISRYGNYYLDGIDQVLIIIARHFIFSECGKTSDNIVESTIQVLKRWIGMTDNNEKEDTLVNRWFQEYGVDIGSSILNNVVIKKEMRVRSGRHAWVAGWKAISKRMIMMLIR